MAKNKKSTGLSLSTVFSLISMVLFIVKTVNSFSEGAKAGGASGIIKFAVLPLIIVFAICFFVQVIASIKDQKAVKESIGDAKYQIKTTKKVASIMEAVSVIVAILLAYDEYASGNIKWYNFRYYFTLIILLFTFLSTVYYIVKTSLKLKKSSDKRKEQQAKALEKAQKAEERQKQIEAATAEKERRAEERKAQEQAAMPKKDQSHKPVKKFTKK